MSSTPRVSLTDPNAVLGLRMIMGHQQELFDRFYSLYGTMWSHGELDQATKEIVRIRNARTTDCGFCRQVRFDGAIKEGLDEDVLSNVVDGYLETDLPDRTKALLRWTDCFLSDPLHCPPEVRSAVIAEIGQSGEVELAYALGLFRAFAKVLIVLGLEPEPGTMDVKVHSTPGSKR
jgi:AhpD family alkylhydroperoxidase